MYDPGKNDLSGWLRLNSRLDVIDTIDNWTSPKLGIYFDLSGEALQIYRPNGEQFATYVEIAQRLDQAEQRAQQG